MPSTKPPTNLGREFALGLFLIVLFCGGLISGLTLHENALVFISSAALAYPLAVILHELGHAFIARAFGHSVLHIKLGESLDPDGLSYDFSLLGFPWKVYSPVITAGIVRHFPTQASHYRRHCFLIAAAGPLVSGLAALPGFLLLLTPRLSTPDYILLGWTYVNAMFCLGTLVPRMVGRKKKFRTDGLNLIRFARMKPAEAESLAADGVFSRQMLADRQPMEDLSVEEAEKLIAAQPEKPWLRYHLLRKLDDLRCARSLLDLADRSDIPKGMIARAMDTFLTNHLAKGPPPDAILWDDLSRRMLEFDRRASAQGTRGCVLVELGREREGCELLQAFATQATDDNEKAYSHIFIGIAARQLGQMDSARKHAQRAAQLSPRNPALVRVADLLADVT